MSDDAQAITSKERMYREVLERIASRELEARRAVTAGEHNTTFAIDLASMARLALEGTLAHETFPDALRQLLTAEVLPLLDHYGELKLAGQERQGRHTARKLREQLALSEKASADVRRCMCGLATIPEGELRIEVGSTTHRLAGPCFQTPSENGSDGAP